MQIKFMITEDVKGIGLFSWLCQSMHRQPYFGIIFVLILSSFHFFSLMLLVNYAISAVHS